MSTNYVQVLQHCHQGTPFYLKGEPTDYDALIFIATSYTKAELDADWLPTLKWRRCREIDAHTQELIDKGFDFNGDHFPLDPQAQLNWTSLDEVRADLTYPVDVATADDMVYTLPDEPTLHQFCLTAMGKAKSNYDSGRALKTAIMAAQTEDEVNDIHDDRV